MSKRRVPWFARRRLACPACGKLTPDVDTRHETFICPRCNHTISMTDFWEDNHDKNSIQADLSQEEGEV